MYLKGLSHFLITNRMYCMSSLKDWIIQLYMIYGHSSFLDNEIIDRIEIWEMQGSLDWNEFQTVSSINFRSIMFHLKLRRKGFNKFY